jgi:phosphotransferase system HPr (HPr) family protein
MIYKELRINNPSGLKSRPAALFVQVAGKYESQILIESDNKKVNAKSIMGVLSLGIKAGDSIFIIVNGVDEKEALEALEEMLEANMD